MANHFSSRYRVLEVRSQLDLEMLLERMWPTKAVPAHELFERLQLSPFDESIIKSDLGFPRSWYTPKELAAYFWKRSNYYASEQRDICCEDD
ncbi:hypothetical protein MW364_004634 [Vibrio parahaemolyticus]|nr:hypothetical protein [Vibrio parahaemolyticus]